MLYTKMCNYTDIECKLLSMNYQDELDEASAEGSTRFFN